MNPIQHAANILRDTAKTLDDLQSQLLLPFEQTSIQAAVSKLRAALGDVYICVQSSLHFHPGMAPRVKWTLYDGIRHHDGTTLQATVNAALAANTPPAHDAVEEVSAALDSSMQPAF